MFCWGVVEYVVLQVQCWLLGNIIFKDSGSCVGRAATMYGFWLWHHLSLQIVCGQAYYMAGL